jgi:hypothetical protein
VPVGDGKSWKWAVTGPAGTTATSISTDNCWTSVRKDSGRIVYGGNGGYSLQLLTYSTDRCTGTPTTTAYGWNVTAGVAIGQPAPLLLRPQNCVTGLTQLIKFSPYDGPGSYVMVARATWGTSSTAWSAPVTLKVLSPFDISLVTFPDRRGPSYQLRGQVREKAIAGGRVTVAVAKGKKGKRFRTLGKARVNSQGVFKLRFRLSRGTYRVRYSYRGGEYVTRGTVYAGMKITRRVF